MNFTFAVSSWYNSSGQNTQELIQSPLKYGKVPTDFNKFWIWPLNSLKMTSAELESQGVPKVDHVTSSGT